MSHNEVIEQLKEDNHTLRREIAELKQKRTVKKVIGSDTPIFRHVDRDKLQSIVESMPVAVSWADPHGLVEFTNKRFTELFGYDTVEIPSMQEWHRLAYPNPEYRKTVVRKWQVAVLNARRKQTDIETMNVSITCKNGRVRDVALKGAQIGDSLLAIFCDLNEPM